MAATWTVVGWLGLVVVGISVHGVLVAVGRAFVHRDSASLCALAFFVAEVGGLALVLVVSDFSWRWGLAAVTLCAVVEGLALPQRHFARMSRRRSVSAASGASVR